MLSLRMRMRMKIASMCWEHCITLVSDTCLVYMISWRVFKRIFLLFYQWWLQVQKANSNDFVQSGIYWLTWLASIGRFLALFDLQVIHLSEHCLLVLFFSTWSLFSVTLSIWRQRCRLSYMTCNKYLPKRATLFLLALVSVLEKLLGPCWVTWPPCTQGDRIIWPAWSHAHPSCDWRARINESFLG